MLPREPIKDRALGRWPGILSALGVPAKALRNRHGPCPLPGCGGRDRFRFDDKGGRGTWICNQCGAGDGIELVKRLQGLEFKDAAKLIELHIGSAEVAAGHGGQSDSEKRDEMIATWKRSKQIELEDCAGRYLNARTGLTTFPSSLRFSPDERYIEPGKRASWHPALIAKVDPCDAAVAKGERASLHRTYLDQFGSKAEVTAPRKMMGSMPTGAAVRLMPHDQTLGIAEGVETAISASILFNMPVWAALTAGLMQEWSPPASVTTAFIFGDNDVSSTGQAAAFTLAQRLKAKGIAAFVELPPTTGDDWNDVWIKQRTGSRANVG